MRDEEQEGGHASWPIVWNVWCKCLESGLRLTVFPVGSTEIFVSSQSRWRSEHTLHPRHRHCAQ